MTLFEYAYCGKDYWEKLEDLARKCSKDAKSVRDEIENAFIAASSNKDLVENRGKNAWFDTGLATTEGKSVYATFVPNKNNAQPWFLTGFVFEEPCFGLFDYAYCPDFDRKIQDLADLIIPEKWSFEGRADNGILRNYINNTFNKLWSEGNGKIVEKEGYALFNTGLFTEKYQSVYGYFVRRKVSDWRQQWELDGFFSSYELASNGVEVDSSARRADYFAHPEELVFDVNSNIYPQYEHILHDAENVKRLPREMQGQPYLQNLFDGAVKRTRDMLEANYKIAVPQWYHGRIQLLVPLYLQQKEEPDICLVISKDNGKDYTGRTCLTLEMAYNNARLIARPESNWLKP